ncbi:MAG: rod-binding protein [Planctomycetota bacterium]
MEISPAFLTAHQLNPANTRLNPSAPPAILDKDKLNAQDQISQDVLHDKFQEFVAGTFYKTLLAAMRKTTSGKTLIHGGRAEEIFQSQLDNTLTDQLANSHGSSLSDKMYQQFLRQIGSPRSDLNGTSDPGVGLE